MESSRGIKLKEFLFFVILLILQTCTHPKMRAENIDPKQGRLEPQKGSQVWKNESFSLLKFEIRWGMTSVWSLVLCAPTHGWLRLGVRLTLDKKRRTKK